MKKEETQIMRVRKSDHEAFKAHCKTLRGGRGETMTREFERIVSELPTIKKEGE